MKGAKGREAKAASAAAKEAEAARKKEADEASAWLEVRENEKTVHQNTHNPPPPNPARNDAAIVPIMMHLCRAQIRGP